MTEIKLPKMAAVQQTAEEEAQDAEKSLDFIKKMSIQSQSELQFAVGAVAEVKERHEEIDGKRRQFVDPLKSVIKDIDDFFKPAINSLKEAEQLLKGKISEFVDGCSNKRNELIDRAGRASQEGDANAASALLSTADSYIVPKVEGLSIRESVEVEILDHAAAIEWCVSNNRQDLLQIDEKALKAVCKAKKRPQIPGVRISIKSTSAITTSKVQR